MLVNMNYITDYAEKNGCAVGAFDAVGLAEINAILRAAEEVNEPVILMPYFLVYPIEFIGPAAIALAKEAKVPVCVHLDHAEDFDLIMKAVRMGFTSVMIDASKLPYEENASISSEIAKIAHPMGVSVEAELGQMTRSESGEELRKEALYTDPDIAKEFIEKTGIDLLAISFGTVHGIYHTKPVLNTDIVAQVREKTNGFPLVMHGGSGLSDEEYRRSIKAGIRKVNYFTYMERAGGAAMRELASAKAQSDHIFYREFEKAAYNAMREDVKHAISIFSMK